MLGAVYDGLQPVFAPATIDSEKQWSDLSDMPDSDWQTQLKRLGCPGYPDVRAPGSGQFWVMRVVDRGRYARWGYEESITPTFKTPVKLPSLSLSPHQ